MIQRGERLRFTLEASNALTVLCEGFWQHFDCNVASEICVGSAVDLAHATGADGTDDFVWAEAETNCERHYFVGARRFSSSSKCCTTMTCGGAAVWSEPPPALIMRNRCPSGETSYVRP